MYSKELRTKAIELYIRYDHCKADVIHELGYPSKNVLKSWYKEYLFEKKNGAPRQHNGLKYKFTDKQKAIAVEHYIENGCKIARTVRMLGYPTKDTLKKWCDELAPDARKLLVERIQYTQEQKSNAVIALCTKSVSSNDLAKEYGVSKVTLYKWKKKLLGKEEDSAMSSKNEKPLKDQVESLRSEAESLKQQVRKLKLEVDILKGTAELIKKGPGVDPKNLTNREKAILVDALRKEHPLKEAIDSLDMARSSYFYHLRISRGPGRYDELRQHIRELFKNNGGRYGYRRIHALLRREELFVSEKVIRHIMIEADLVVVCKKKRKYSSYQGDVSLATANLIERDFHADAPNVKWLTDITEFNIPAGKVYLSPVIDCFDGMVTSWKIGTCPDANLVNDMLDLATGTLKYGEYPLIHSDQGIHYRWAGWIARMDANGLKRSMSRKGCAPDNAACEGFFGRLKNEFFYFRSWIGVSIKEFINVLHKYLIWYNEKRIKLSLGGMSPLEYRRSLGFVV
jgi:transposase InsO family protein/transposase-like protein